MRKQPNWNRVAAQSIGLAVILVFAPDRELFAFQEPSVCSRCQNVGSCVPKMQDYPAFQSTYGNPYRIFDCSNEDCQGSAVQRWKRSMQQSHWGYPEHFQKNAFGVANRNAFSANIRDGAIEKTTLYQLDFYPENSPQAHMLTPKGLERLEKALCVSQAYGTGLQFEQAARAELNDQRRAWLAEHPEVLAAGISSVDIRQAKRPMGIQAAEAIRRYQQGISSPVGGAPLYQNAASPAGLPQSGVR